MKKGFISISILFLFLFPQVYAYSSGFEYMIQAMNIEKVNVNGLMINEEVYEKYHLLSYGEPSAIKHKDQRFKSTQSGNWTMSGGAWKGTGTRGEYWILGEDYTGKLIHNEIFPDDFQSGTSPLNWNYRIIKDAEESWNDRSKYQYEIQRDYMLHSKLSRFGVTYDLTALDIGLAKARVENYATWGSAGSIYTEKPGQGNIYWVATFSVPPMAGNARLNSILEFPGGKEYTMAKEAERIEIPLQFGAVVEGLSDYARPEHVKTIEAKLSVNHMDSDTVSDSKLLKITKDGNLVVEKADFPDQSKVVLEVSCDSFLATCFPNDPILYAEKTVKIIVNIESEKKNIAPVVNKGEDPPAIYSCTLKRVSTNSKGKEEEVPLYTSLKTNTQFICAGQVLKIEVKVSADAKSVRFDFHGKDSIRTLDTLTKRFEWEEPKERNTKTRFATLSELERAYDFPLRMKLKSETEEYKIYTATYVIPYGTAQTLHSWNSLRENAKDAFAIDESKLFTRKEAAYGLVVTAVGKDGTRSKSYALDVAERWDELYNRNLTPYVTVSKK